MAKNELLPFADGEDANVLPTNQWEALTDILENGFQSGIAKSEQVNRVLAQGAVASYVLGQLIVDELNQDATLDKDTLYQRLVSALESKAKDVCLSLSGGNVMGNLTVQGKNVLRSVNGSTADASGNASISVPPTPKAYVTETYRNGANWYRKYSDGWIEQGGVITSPPIYTEKTQTLHCAMTSSDYVVQLQLETSLEAFARVFSQTATSFNWSACRSAGSGSNITSLFWYACGY